MKILVMDDSVSRLECFQQWLSEHELVMAETAPEAQVALLQSKFDMVFLDHDLGYSQPTGSYMTRQWKLNHEKYATKHATVVVHTSSEAGASLMMDDLRNMSMKIIRRPFYMLTDKYIQRILRENVG